MRPAGQAKNIQQAKKRNIEIINNLKQTLSTPTIVEAQRTLKIMDKLIQRIHIFLNLDSEFIIKFNQINNPAKLKLNKTHIQQLSQQVLDLIAKEAKLQSQFKSYAAMEQQIKEGETIQEQKINEYNRVKNDMEYSFKTLVRALQKSPSDIQILKKLKSNTAVNNEGLNIHEALCNYKIIMQKKLATAAEEEDSHTKQIEDLKSKIDSLEKSKNKVSEQLRLLRQEKAKHMEDKKQQMDKLKSQIRQVQSNQQKQLEKIMRQNKQMNEQLAKLHKTTQDKLKSQITNERLKLNKLREQSLKNQTKLKADKMSNENNLIQLISTYDKQMFTLVNSKNEAQKELKRISDELNNLKRHFQQIQQEKKRQQKLVQADKKRRERWELQERRKGQAITKIKQAYRLWKAKSKKKKKKRN